MVPLVILPLVPLTAIGTIGSLKTPNGYRLPLVTLNNESRLSFVADLLQQQIDPLFSQYLCNLNYLYRNFN